MSDELTFEEPPTQERLKPNSEMRAWLDALRSEPGRWCRCPKEWSLVRQAYGTASQIRRGFAWGVKSGEYECKTRTIDGKGVLYARYVGAAVES